MLMYQYIRNIANDLFPFIDLFPRFSKMRNRFPVDLLKTRASIVVAQPKKLESLMPIGGCLLAS